jgi:hypothetical protein
MSGAYELIYRRNITTATLFTSTRRLHALQFKRL